MAKGRRNPLAVPSEEGHHVLLAETTIAALAHAIEGQLAAIAQSFDRVHMEWRSSATSLAVSIGPSSLTAIDAMAVWYLLM